MAYNNTKNDDNFIPLGINCRIYPICLCDTCHEKLKEFINPHANASNSDHVKNATKCTRYTNMALSDKPTANMKIGSSEMVNPFTKANEEHARRQKSYRSRRVATKEFGAIGDKNNNPDNHKGFVPVIYAHITKWVRCVRHLLRIS
ncbi:hypothetical protein AHYW_002657 [Providencia manganoxydans]